MYESAEKVTDRRIALNQFNYGISTAIFLAIAFMWNWVITTPTYGFAGLLVILMLSGLATVFTFFWVRQIQSYKLLNNAKFKVMEEMAENLAFPSPAEGLEVVSCQPFKKEWEELKVRQGVVATGRWKILTLKSSNLEYFVPRAFRLVFVFLALISVLAICLKFEKFIIAMGGLLG